MGVTDTQTAAKKVRDCIICPVHKQRDCSPLLNGCTRVIEAHAMLAMLVEAASAREGWSDPGGAIP